MKKLLVIMLIFIAFLFSRCVDVKAYQKAYLNDEDMDLGARLIDGHEVAFQSYREGASGANGGKVGGGCGCN